MTQVDAVREEGRRVEPLWLSGVGSRETTSTLAGEYVTAREYVGKPEVLLEFRGEKVVPKKHARQGRSDEAMEE